MISSRSRAAIAVLRSLGDREKEGSKRAQAARRTVRPIRLMRGIVRFRAVPKRVQEPA